MPTGFFCSQECFATNWLAHRDSAHKSGVAKVGSKRRRAKPEDGSVDAKDNSASSPLGAAGEQRKAKKSRSGELAVKEAAAAVALAADKQRVQGWKPVSTSLVTLTPAVVLDSQSRVIIGIPVPSSCGVDAAIWCACVGAAQLIEATIAAGLPQEFVIVVNGSFAAFAMAWALRCAGGKVQQHFSLVLSTSDEDLAELPDNYFTGGVKVAITTTDVLRLHGKKHGNSVSLWSNKRTVITLPDVPLPDEFQAVNARGIFFVATVATAAKASSSTVICSPADATFEVSDITSKLVPKLASLIHPFAHPPPPSAGSSKFDNIAASHFARGNLLTALDKIVAVYSGNAQRCEEVLENLLLHDWGCVGDEDVAHQRLAYVVRSLYFASGQFSKVQGSMRLSELAVRVAARVARFMAPIASKDKRTANVALHATLCFIFSTTPAPTMDTLAAAWGITHVVPGLPALSAVLKQREGIVSRITKRYGAKLSPLYAQFLSILMCLLYDSLLKYSLTESDVEAMTQWTLLFQHEVGTLKQFLAICELDASASSATAARPLMAGKQTSAAPATVAHDPATTFITPKSQYVSKALPTLVIPITGTRSREVEKLKQIAAEEVLSAMPKQPIPMYVGDVGNLIGIWTKFNAKYDGILGLSLVQFLEDRSDDFQVVGNVVTRRVVGRGDQVRVRFDNNRDSDSEDDDTRKNRDRRMLTGDTKKKGKKDEKGEAKRGAMHSKARRKQMKKDQNLERFNKNRQTFDQSAKVPGYIKRGPRKLKGRGKKINIRRFKRGASE